MMKFSTLVERISGESVNVWKIHNVAKQCQLNGEDIIVLIIGEEANE